MSNYIFTVPEQADVTWTSANGPQTRQVAAGSRHEFNDPCEAYSFATAYLQKTGVTYNPSNDAMQLGTIAAACRGRPTPQTVTQTTDAPDPTVAPVPTQPSDETTATPPPQNPPSNPTSPDAVDAQPDPTVVSGTTHQTPPPSQPNAVVPPEQRAYDPQTPNPESVIPTAGDPGGAGSDATDRVQRNDPTPGLPHYEFGLNNATDSHVAADPVDLFSGTYTLIETDFELPAARFSLTLQRRYRSGIPYFGPWGYNWDHNHNSYARPLDDGYVAVWTGLLNEDVYAPQTDGTYLPPLGKTTRLVHNRAGLGSSENYQVMAPDGSTWTYARPDGWTRSDRLPIVHFYDRFGNGFTYDYDGENRLARVTDTDGNQLSFHYGHCGFLESVSDQTGRTLRYWHDEDRAHLIKVFRPPTPEAPEGAAISYEYDSHEQHGRLRHNMTKVIDEMGRPKLLNIYCKDPNSDGFARVETQFFGCHRADFQYTRLASPSRLPNAINLAAWRVETLVDGVYKLLTFNFRGNLLEERYRLARDGSYRLHVTVNRYDAWGNLQLAALPNGFLRRYTYDIDNPNPAAWGNLLRVDLEAPPTRPTLGRNVVQMRYEDRYQQIHWVRDESGAITRMQYDHFTQPNAKGALVQIDHPDVALPDGGQQTASTRVQVNSKGQVVQQVSPMGRKTVYAYNARGLLSEITRDPDGLNLKQSFSYDAYGNVTQTRDGLGNGIELEFDARNRVTRAWKPMIDGIRPEIQFLYYPTGQIAEHIRPYGLDGKTVRATYRYDALGRQLEQITAAGTDQARRSALAYDAWDRIVKMTDPLGREHRHCYDERGKLLSLTRSGPSGHSRSVRWIHDINGMTTQVIFADGSHEHYFYDAWDRPIRVEQTPTDASQTKSYYSYAADDQIANIETYGPDGHGVGHALLLHHQFQYDARGRLIRQNAGLGDVVTWLDADGLIDRVVDPAGAETMRHYDNAGRLVGVTDPIGNQTELILDAADRLQTLRIVEPNPAGPPTDRDEHRRYNVRNEQISYTDFLGRMTQYDYDHAGRLWRTTNPNATSETLHHDLHGDVILVRNEFSGQSTETKFARDGFGRIVSFQDAAGSETKWRYDDFDAVVQRIHPDGSIEQSIFDNGGRLQQRILPSGTTYTYSYAQDGATQSIQTTPAAGLIATPDVMFQRDGLGRLRQATQGPHHLQRRYDISGRLTAEVLNGHPLGQSHDDLTNTHLRSYSDGRQDRYTFDPLGRLASVAMVQVGSARCTGPMGLGDFVKYDYSGTSKLERRTLSAGVISAFDYDQGLRLKQIHHQDSAGDDIAQIDYGYDPQGSRNHVAVVGAPWTSWDIQHDDQFRVVSLDDGVVQDSFDIDAADGRQRWQRQSDRDRMQVDTSTNARHQIINRTVTTASGTDSQLFSYAADGPLTQDHRYTYVYDGFGHVREIRNRTDNSLILTFDWDPVGRLHSVSRPDQTRVTLWHFDQELQEYEHQPAAQLVQQTPGMMPAEIIMHADGHPHFHLTDARSSLLASTSLAGLATSRRSFTPFGETTLFDAQGANAAPDTQIIVPNAFGGMHYLPDVQLYVSGERLYDPQTGCFLQPDPMGLFDSANLYSYCRHNPIDFMDPSGHWVESAWDVLSLGIGVASLTYNLTRDQVDWWAVGLDAVGIVADTAALILPGVPGGAGAAIKAARTARAGGEAIEQITRVGRAVRYTQAAHGATMAARGVHMSYEQAAEGNYGTAALGVGLSAMGIRGSMGRFQTAWRAGRVPSSLYSVQGNAGDITRSGQIWGMTEGRVWAGPQLGAHWSKTGLAPGDLPPAGERLVLEFTDGAQNAFQHHTVWGIFTGWKGLYGNQHVTDIGDLALKQMGEVATFSTNIRNSGLAGYFVQVTKASQIPAAASHQSQWVSRARAAFPIGFDMMLNTVPALMAGGLGMAYGTPNGNSTSHRTGNGHPQILTGATPSSGDGAK